MSCCPPGSEGYLEASETSKGTTFSDENGYEFYVIGTESGSKNAVVLVPDVWGWNGGRTRVIADSLADIGYAVIVPKLLVPAFNGGTDGDGN